MTPGKNMHLERNLNPQLSGLYMATGIALIGVSPFFYGRFPWWVPAFLVVSGISGVASGALHH